MLLFDARCLACAHHTLKRLQNSRNTTHLSVDHNRHRRDSYSHQRPASRRPSADSLQPARRMSRDGMDRDLHRRPRDDRDPNSLTVSTQRYDRRESPRRQQRDMSSTAQRGGDRSRESPRRQQRDNSSTAQRGGDRPGRREEPREQRRGGREVRDVANFARGGQGQGGEDPDPSARGERDQRERERERDRYRD